MANGQYKRTSHKNHAKSRFQLGILEVILGFISNSLRDKYILSVLYYKYWYYYKYWSLKGESKTSTYNRI